MRAETRLQLDLCEWLRDVHPTVMFHSDLSSGMALSVGQATMNKRLQFTKGMPDLYIFKPKYLEDTVETSYCGLFLELKAETSQQIKKDGTMGNEKHIVEQRTVHQWLEERGYKACFAIGLDQAKQIINDYLT